MPNIIRYRNYKKLNNEVFINDLEEQFSENNEFQNFESFKLIVGKTLDKYAPIKKRYVRANQAPFMNKRINQEIMKRSRLRNKFLNTKSDIDRRAYNKQRNICVTLTRQQKKNFLSKLNTREVTDNKKFWRKVKPLFTDKIQTKSKITLIEKKLVSNQGDKVIETEETISEDKAIAEIFNKFFINIVPNLKISIENDFDTSFIPTEDLVQNAISKYRNHPSVVIIKEKNNLSGKFSFSLVQYDDILKKVRNSDTAKASKQTDIPTKILKHNSEYFAEYFYDNINYCIENSNLPSDLKSADVTPAYKKSQKPLKIITDL